MTNPILDFDDFCPAHNVRPFINDILQNSSLTIAQIAKECHLPEKELYRIMAIGGNCISHVSRGLFNKIIYFYCYMCCKNQVIPLAA